MSLPRWIFKISREYTPPVTLGKLHEFEKDVYFFSFFFKNRSWCLWKERKIWKIFHNLCGDFNEVVTRLLYRNMQQEWFFSLFFFFLFQKNQRISKRAFSDVQEDWIFLWEIFHFFKITNSKYHYFNEIEWKTKFLRKQKTHTLQNPKILFGPKQKCRLLKPPVHTEWNLSKIFFFERFQNPKTSLNVFEIEKKKFFSFPLFSKHETSFEKSLKFFFPKT